MPSSTVQQKPSLAADLRDKIDAYWRAANYLCVGQIFLQSNPLLKKPLEPADIKPRLLGHWGTTPGLNFIYAHMNRLIVERDLDAIFITGPGHGGPAAVANTYLEGSYSELFPEVSPDEAGLKQLFRQFSWPYGVPSHAAPETPGSIHEGGELGYSLLHAYGAAFDNPDLIVCCVVGDGEAETGPCATSWHSNKFLNPARDGAVLPVLHLNDYKIANPTVLARLEEGELPELFHSCGYEPLIVSGDDPETMHGEMAATLDAAIDQIQAIQQDARRNGFSGRPRWPMIILQSPKGWTGPESLDGKPVEGSFRSHQVPLPKVRQDDEQRRMLEQWMKSYRPEELFDSEGRLRREIAETTPKGDLRMGTNPHANGGRNPRDLELPPFRDYAVDVPEPGKPKAEATRVLGQFLRDVMKRNIEGANFRVFSPDETSSNRLDALYEVTQKAWVGKTKEGDENLSPDGRVMEVLSEHMCQGWLEGYLLTGRHGFFSCYEAFVHIVDSMFNQHAKWLESSRHIHWRNPTPSLNYLLTSHVWRQDHNGFSHQDPGFLDVVLNKKANVVRVYLPPDANCLLAVTDHCLRSHDYVNVIVAGKQPEPQWLEIDAATEHCAAGIGKWNWASNDDDGETDIVMACAGDVPTLETLAAVSILRRALPQLRIRVVNVVDLVTLQPQTEHPHGLDDESFDELFTTDRPIVFAFHGYPWLIHRLTYRRTNHGNLHVRGYKEEGATTTPFDMAVRNDIDRYHLALDAIARLRRIKSVADAASQMLQNKLDEHHEYVRSHGEDMPEVRDWEWKTPQ